MTTLATIVTMARERLDEATATFWTTTELERWANDGLRDIARRCELLQDRDDITVVAGTREYTAPSDVIRIHRVELRITGDSSVYPLEYADFNNMDAVWWNQQAITQGTPIYYTTWGFPPTLKIVLYPTPSAGGTLKVFNYRMPATATSASEIELPTGWDDVLVDYIEYCALRKDRDPRWQEAKQLYEQRLSDLYDLTRRWTDQAGHITPGYHGGAPLWLTHDIGW